MDGVKNLSFAYPKPFASLDYKQYIRLIITHQQLLLLVAIIVSHCSLTTCNTLFVLSSISMVCLKKTLTLLGFNMLCLLIEIGDYLFLNKKWFIGPFSFISNLLNDTLQCSFSYHFKVLCPLFHLSVLFSLQYIFFSLFLVKLCV